MNLSRRIIPFIFIFVFAVGYSIEPKRIALWPETKSGVDSLNSLLRNETDTIALAKIYLKSFEIAEKINYLEGLFTANENAGVQLRNLSKYTEALKHHKKSLEIAEKIGNIKLQENALNNIGVIYRRTNNTRLALDYHMKALKLAENIHDIKNICISVNSIGNIYVSLGQYNEALKCFNRALSLEMKRGNNLGVSINYNNIGWVYRSKNQLDSALIFFRKSLYYDELIHHKPGIAICENSIGEILLQQNKIDEALIYFDKALQINIEVKDQIYIAESYLNLASVFLQKNELNKAIELFNKSLKISIAIGSKSGIQQAYYGLSESFKKLHNFENALSYYQKAVEYSDSLLNEENIKHITQIQSQYDFEKKEQQIVILEKDKETSRLYSLLLSILVLVILVVSVFIILNIRQKRLLVRQELDLKEQRIRDLELEKQLLATQSVLQGEESERTRLARDLHDGLGGLLSGVKLAMSNIKGNVYLQQEQVGQFDHALGLIDTSICELRRVAHNMMPEALVKFGLKDALNDFCRSINNSNINVVFNFYGKASRIDRKYENSMYRIAQELINNALKHSRASEIAALLVQEDKRLNFVVQDNGIGFDTNSILQLSKGAGLANIRSRAESLNGWIDISSEPGKGTEITIEFNF